MRSPRRRLAYVLCLVGLCLGAALIIRRVTQAGPVIATVPVGMLPSAIGVDDATGHALVLNALDTTVSVLDERTGALLATRTVGSNGGAHPEQIAVDARTGHAFVLTDDGQVSMLDTRSGGLLSAIQLSGSPSAIDIDQETARAFVAETDAGAVAVLDTRTGALLRTVPVGTFPEQVVCSAAASLTLVANQGDNTVSVLDARNGRPLRTVRAGNAPDGLAISDRYRSVFIADANGSIAGIDAHTGLRRFRRMLVRKPGKLPDLLVADDDTSGLLVIAFGTHIEELDPSSGIVRRVLTLPSAITALAVDPRSGDVLATVRGKVDVFGHLSGDGSLLIFAPGGNRIETDALGLNPVALAIDPHNRRVLVADTNLNPDGSGVHGIPAPDNALTALERRLRRWLPGLPSGDSMPSKGGSVNILRLEGG